MSPPLAKTLYSFRMISKLDSLPENATYIVIIYPASSISCDCHQDSWYSNLTEGLGPSPTAAQPWCDFLFSLGKVGRHSRPSVSFSWKPSLTPLSWSGSPLSHFVETFPWLYDACVILIFNCFTFCLLLTDWTFISVSAFLSYNCTKWAFNKGPLGAVMCAKEYECVLNKWMDDRIGQ